MANSATNGASSSSTAPPIAVPFYDATDSSRHEKWKNHVPLLYDTLCPSHFSWGTLSAAFGPAIWEPSPGVTDNQEAYYLRLLYAPRTDATYDPKEGCWHGGPPSCLTIGRFKVPRKHYTDMDDLASLSDTSISDRLALEKRIIHPGEVNRVRSFPCDPRFCATHADSPYVYVWNIVSQQHTGTMSVQDETKIPVNKPDAVLTGHEDDATFAMDVDKFSYQVLSGGRDKNVILWNVADIDHANAASSSSSSAASGAKRQKMGQYVCNQSVPDIDLDECPNDIQRGHVEPAGSENSVIGAPTLSPRGIFKGHTDFVEDVSFKPEVVASSVTDDCARSLNLGASSPQIGNSESRVASRMFCSAGRDKSLLVWDPRAGMTSVCGGYDVHSEDINCVDWGMFNNSYILTGSSDHCIKIHDVRKMNNSSKTASGDSSGSSCVVKTLRYHIGDVISVAWNPTVPGVFLSAAEDGRIAAWDINQTGGPKGVVIPFNDIEQRQQVAEEQIARDNSDPYLGRPSELLFVHEGHRSPLVVDVQWSPLSWDFSLMLSLSDDAEDPGKLGGSTLHLFRPRTEIFG